MKKKVLSVLSIALIFAILGAFAACGNKTEGTATTTTPTTEAPKSTLKILPDALEGSTETYVIGFRKGDQALRDKVQTILCEMKKDGTMAQISTTWFGSDMTTVKETADIKTPATDNSLEKVLEAKKLVLGLDATFKPMGFTDDQNNIVGFDIDLAKEVCKRLGVELELKGIDWETKEKTLDANQIDCIWNGMSYSDKRNEAMNLSEAYMDNKMVFVVSASGAIASQADLSQKKVAVQSGSTAQEILEASAIAKDIEIVAIGTNVEALQQLNLNMVDAVFLDSVVAEYEIVQMLKTK